MSRYRFDEPTVVIPARIAWLFAGNLDLEKFRDELRGMTQYEGVEVVNDLLTIAQGYARQRNAELAALRGTGHDSERNLEEDEPMSSVEAARVTGLGPRGIRKAAAEGRIPGATKPNGDWVLPAPAVHAFREARNSR